MGNNNNEGGDGSDQRMKPCFSFNEGGVCKYGSKCWFRHACMKCDSFSHGKANCPN
jgi:hypothetical protein